MEIYLALKLLLGIFQKFIHELFYALLRDFFSFYQRESSENSFGSSSGNRCTSCTKIFFFKKCPRWLVPGISLWILSEVHERGIPVIPQEILSAVSPQSPLREFFRKFSNFSESFLGNLDSSFADNFAGDPSRIPPGMFWGGPPEIPSEAHDILISIFF